MAEKGVYQKAQEAAEKAARTKVLVSDGVKLHEYPDYETYRQVQTDGNKAKLRKQFVKRSHIEALAEYLTTTYGPVQHGLCHGTRAGREQRWFRNALPGQPDVLGTEISDSAAQFENTVQWDFHDENPDWLGRMDFVSSNSWDHAFDPGRAFRVWVGSLKPGGLLLLDHTRGHMPAASNALDPFGATFEALSDLLMREIGEQGELLQPVDRMASPDYRALVLVFRKKG